MLKIGKMNDGSDVYISEKSPNRHISVLGISGSGKTVRLRELISNVIASGETALVFDINGMDYRDCTDKVNVISAKKDGLNARLLDTGLNTSAENGISYVTCIVRVLCRAFRLGSKQEEALRNAILYAMRHAEAYTSDLEAIEAGLQEQATVASDSVESRLWEFLNINIARRNQLQMRTGYANVISFEGISKVLQSVWVEVLLALLWNNLRRNAMLVKTLWIFIDEFQNLSLKKDSVLPEMLQESRKYGVNIVLATQSVTGYEKDIMAAIDQTAVHLYFQQSLTDVKKVAASIDVRKKTFWETKLKSLRVGESVAVGNFDVRGRNISNPIIVKSAYAEGCKKIRDGIEK